MNVLIKKEYFDLVNKLNSSNKLKNENTEIYFYIDQSEPGVDKLFAAVSAAQKILLLERHLNGNWEPKYLSGCDSLEEDVVKILNANREFVDLTILIKSHVFKLE